MEQLHLVATHAKGTLRFVSTHSLFSNIDAGHLQALEEAAFVSWPAAEVGVLDGWRVRAAHGVTGRANSVWSQEIEGDATLAQRIDAVERFYAERGLPSRFQMNAGARPAELDTALAARGYSADNPTLVQIAPMEAILQGTPPLRSMPHIDIVIAEEFEQEWFELYEINEGEDPAFATGRAQILQRIDAPRAFLRADIDGVPAAVALGVLHNGLLCISNVSTAAHFRRRGAASAMLRALAIWSRMYDGREAFLQVKANNEIALALYARAGFATAYNYHYRLLARAEPDK